MTKVVSIESGFTASCVRRRCFSDREVKRREKKGYCDRNVTFLTAQAIQALLGVHLGPLAHSRAKCKAIHLGTDMRAKETVQMFAENFPLLLVSLSVHLNTNLSLPGS